jgi:hypothetical protein
LAQLPTPMMATRTFSFWYRLPPLVDGAWPMCEDKLGVPPIRDAAAG